MRSFKTIAAAAAALGVVATGAAAATSSSATPKAVTTPYMVRMHASTEIKQIMTVGDSVKKTSGGTYRMAGLPDGLGALDNGDGTFTVLMNHELTDTIGVARAHGGIGSFVSKWIVKKDDLSIVSGDDLIKTVNLYTGGTYVPTAGVTLSRFCSADLPALSAFYNETTKLGFNGRLFMNGEEKGPEGRAFAHELNGTSWELPHLGKFSWENTLANWGSGDKTVVIGQDDAGGGKGQVYVYVGDKKAAGNTVEKAGLSGGSMYGIAVTGFAAESGSSGIPDNTRFTLSKVENVAGKSGAELEAASDKQLITQFRRPEDGAWDPLNANVYYFVTTDAFRGKSRLFRLTFNNVKQPELGGKVDMLLDGSEGQQMLDNIAVDKSGKRIMLQEDIGAQGQRGKMWMYNIATDTLRNIAEHNDDLFNPSKPGFLTADEETSGAIDMTDILGSGWFLLVDQLHGPYAPAGFSVPAKSGAFLDPELVEGGALIAMYVAPPKGPKA